LGQDNPKGNESVGKEERREEGRKVVERERDRRGRGED